MSRLYDFNRYGSLLNCILLRSLGAWSISTH
nr:MAG TPA: hypothetical protein [Bacteriophage sp.]